MPQARHAPAIAKIPAPPPFGPPPRQDNKSAPPRIAAAPTNSRLSTFSRKTSQAIASVARPSRLSSSETVEAGVVARPAISRRSEEHTSELQSLMRLSYAVFCLQKKMQNDPSDQNICRCRNTTISIIRETESHQTRLM